MALGDQVRSLADHVHDLGQREAGGNLDTVAGQHALQRAGDFARHVHGPLVVVHVSGRQRPTMPVDKKKGA